jgi:hypothetical protein
MLINDFLSTQEKRARIERAHARTQRIVMGTAWLALTIFMMIGFATFAWAGANLTPNPEVIPTWMWRWTFGLTAVGMLITSGFCLFAALDEFFLYKNDRRRITRRHTR